MESSASKSVRVRFAPSPTGELHIGSARAALFNYLFAQNQGGSLILRIEDTDMTRSKKEFESQILEGLSWLGIEWDEGVIDGEEKGKYGPYRQSERADIYKKYVQKLLDSNLAYYCFATKEEVEEKRSAMLTSGQTPIFNSPYRNLDVKEALKKAETGEEHVIRFKMPETKMKFTDIIRKEVEFDGKLIGDFVIAKGIDQPLFLLSNLIDDFLMKITHVVRGEDHISNTPRQIALAKALDFSIPKYAHFPLVLNPDKSKMSKRIGASTVEEFRELGYLPEAIFNFLTLLGWHPIKDKDIMSKEEIIKEFSLERIQKGGAIFNIEKLNWFNQHYIREKDNKELLELLKRDFINDELDKLQVQNVRMPSDEQWLKMIDLAKERMKKLSDFFGLIDFFIKLPAYEIGDLKWKDTSKEETLENLGAVQEILETQNEEDFTNEKLEKKLMPLAEERGRGDVLWPLRYALSGKKASPGPFEIMTVLGKQESLLRIDLAINNLHQE